MSGCKSYLRTHLLHLLLVADGEADAEGTTGQSKALTTGTADDLALEGNLSKAVGTGAVSTMGLGEEEVANLLREKHVHAREVEH